METEEEERMRIRRERAAAWKEKKERQDGEESIRKLNEVTDNLKANAQIKFAKEDLSAMIKPERGGADEGGTGDMDSSAGGGRPAWMSWANDVGGGRGGGGGGGPGGRGGGEEREEKEGYGWRHTVGGLGAMSEQYGAHNSISMMIAEKERELEAMDDDYHMPINHRPDQYIDTSRCEIASMDKHIPESNIGHQMLLRMGWKGIGTGLGRGGRGIYDPIPLTSKEMLDLGSKVGVGKIEEENSQHEAATEKGRDLESIIQANETEERRQIREEKVIREHLIKSEVQEIVKPFYCDICDKQYVNDGQFQEHLNSYDHHHKKRFQEFQKEHKQMKGGPTKEERDKREARRMEKEMAARVAASKAAQASAQPPPPPPSEAPPPPPPDDALPAAPVKFGFGMKSKTSAPAIKKASAPAARPAAMAFGDDSD